MHKLITRLVLTVAVVAVTAAYATAQQLEIHYVNVGWGGSVLVKGPDGTTILLEAGNTGKGTQYVVPYLQSIGLQPAGGLDYTIAGHQHCDHIGGLDEVVAAGYNVRVKNFYNGSAYTSTCVTDWANKAATTTAGALAVPAPGQQIALGNGAKLTVVAVNGRIIGGGTVAVSDENDRSIAVLIQYGGFDYIWASDLGGGTIDEACTGRFTSSQTDVESAVIAAISPGGAFPLISDRGIDLLHVNHHGSESSTNKNYMNKAEPAVAIIGVGDGESSGWDLPRIDVVEHVLLGQAAACITAPAAFVFQTEEGNPAGSLTSFSGYSVGDIKVTTDGVSAFTVAASGNVHQGVNELGASGLPRTFLLDDVTTPDTTAPTTSITSPAAGGTVSGVTAVAASASDDRGVARVEFLLDGVLKWTATAAPYTWSWDTTTSANGSHTLTTSAFDAAGNTGTSTPVTVTVSNVADTTAPTTAVTAPADGSTVSGTTTVTASATDNVGVTRVEFYLDGVLTSTDPAAPYAWAWDTTTAAAGAHALTSRAYDAAGNAATSAAVTVAVNNADTTPPSAPTGLTATGATGKITLAWTASTDNVAVTGYQVWRASSASGPFAQIATPPSPTYADTGLKKGTTFYYYVKAFDAAGNLSAASATRSGRAK